MPKIYPCRTRHTRPNSLFVTSLLLAENLCCAGCQQKYKVCACAQDKFCLQTMDALLGFHPNRLHFYPTALKGCRGIVFTHGVRMGGRSDSWVGGRREIVSPGCISETVRCRKFLLGRDIGWGCRCATSWSDLDLTLP